jgi:hypothetical protein
MPYKKIFEEDLPNQNIREKIFGLQELHQGLENVLLINSML